VSNTIHLPTTVSLLWVPGGQMVVAILCEPAGPPAPAGVVAAHLLLKEEAPRPGRPHRLSLRAGGVVRPLPHESLSAADLLAPSLTRGWFFAYSSLQQAVHCVLGAASYTTLRLSPDANHVLNLFKLCDRHMRGLPLQQHSLNPSPVFGGVYPQCGHCLMPLLQPQKNHKHPKRRHHHSRSLPELVNTSTKQTSKELSSGRPVHLHKQSGSKHARATMLPSIL